MTFKILGEGLPTSTLGGLEFYPRSGVDFSPLDIGGLQLWLKADAGTFQDTAKTNPATDNGDVVGAWEDQSGLGNDATQGVTARKPTLRLSVLNSRPVLRFDGNDTVLVPSVTLAGLTIFGVFIASANGFLYEHSPNAELNDGSWVFTTNSFTVQVRRSGSESNKELPANWGSDSVWRIATHRMDGTHVGHQLWLNGVQQALANGPDTNDVGTAVTTNLFSIAARSVPSTIMTGDIAELIAYNSALPNVDRQNVETYLNNRYATF